MLVGQFVEYSAAQEWSYVDEISTTDVEAYLVFLQERPYAFGQRKSKRSDGLSQSTIETIYRHLKRFFNWLLERQLVEANPLDLISHPKIDEKVIPTLSEDEIAGLLESLDPRHFNGATAVFRAVRDTAVVMMLVDTPGRRAEIAAIKRTNVDLEEGRVLVMGKGGKERWLPLGDGALHALWVYIQPRDQVVGLDGPLWVDARGNGMNQRGKWLADILLRRGTAAGLEGLHAHRFRHTYSMTALRNGMPQRILETIGGWRKIPDTYFRTLSDEDAARAHREISPGDRLKRRRRG